MCGIAGLIHLDHSPVSKDIVQKMADAIAHRGPDGEGVFVDDFVGLGHRRLAILDLTSAGHQPMISSNDRFVLSYNGEIFNFQDLRSQLEGLGYSFTSRTDTEVILNAWCEWGPDCITRFNGMFAFVIWDRKTQSLYLVRDRYGIKPLYYGSWNSKFLFGSEQKAIMAHPEVPKYLDKKAVLEYFTFQNIFSDRTFVKNLQILPAGTIACISRSNNWQLDAVQYWDYRFEEAEQCISLSEYQEELDFLMRQAVKRQLVSDVELGCYLSGGMDSGTLTALTVPHRPYIKTFTCGFDLSSASGLELAYDERVKAEAMSALFKTEHYEMVLKAGDMERCMSDLAYHIEEPRVGQSYPNFYVAQLASKFVKVVFSGAGGDELFGGYPWRYYRTTSSRNFEEYIDEYYKFWQRLIPNSIISKVFTPIWDEVKDVWTRDIFKNVFRNHDINHDKPEDYINHSLYFEAKTFLHGLFVVEDKLSMANGLEVRVPFMDNDLVDFAMKCPVKFKLNNLDKIIRINENVAGRKPHQYFNKTKDGKKILRNVMSKYIPCEITNAEKQGFSAPDASWFRGESIDFVKNKLFKKDAQLYEYLDRSEVHSLISEHLSGAENRRLLIWSLLNMQELLETESFNG